MQEDHPQLRNEPVPVRPEAAKEDDLLEGQDSAAAQHGIEAGSPDLRARFSEPNGRLISAHLPSPIRPASWKAISGSAFAIACVSYLLFLSFQDRNVDDLTTLGPTIPDHVTLIPPIPRFSGEQPVILSAPLGWGPENDVVRSESIGLPADELFYPYLDNKSGWNILMEEDGQLVQPQMPEGIIGLSPEQAEGALALDRAMRRNVQRWLTLTGFNPGGADGIFGPRTRSAISRWQQERGRTVTGFLDGDQLSALEQEAKGVLR